MNRISQRNPTPTKKRWIDWLDEHKQARERLMGFFVSCCVHLAILITLSLIAIGTGSVDGPALLVGSASEAEEEMILIPVTDLEVDPDQFEPTAEAENLSFEVPIFSQLSVQSGNKVAQTAAPEVTSEASTTSANPPAPSTNESPENALAGTAKVAAAAIQKRVSKAGGKKGEIQFALAWKNVNDVDLHVITPSGEQISHSHRRSRCAGMLDVDMNVDGESEEPVENIRWITNAPWGRYTVLVNFFKMNSEGVRRRQRESPYQLLVQLGSESMLRESIAGFGERQVTVWRFLYVPDSFSSFEREQMLKKLERLQTQEEAAAAPLLENAKAANGVLRQRILQNLVQSYPHTDASIEALQLIDGEVTKR